MCSDRDTFVLPAYPADKVIDPTGAGDSFAGGLMGYLAAQDSFEPKTLKEAMAYGILVASFNVEDFSLRRFQRTDRDDAFRPQIADLQQPWRALQPADRIADQTRKHLRRARHNHVRTVQPDRLQRAAHQER
jgi:bifunctional ADP-heptose synthase (sugar kinase/adenylyltransferase)